MQRPSPPPRGPVVAPPGCPWASSEARWPRPASGFKAVVASRRNLCSWALCRGPDFAGADTQAFVQPRGAAPLRPTWGTLVEKEKVWRFAHGRVADIDGRTIPVLKKHKPREASEQRRAPGGRPGGGGSTERLQACRSWEESLRHRRMQGVSQAGESKSLRDREVARPGVRECPRLQDQVLLSRGLKTTQGHPLTA